MNNLRNEKNQVSLAGVIIGSQLPDPGWRNPVWISKILAYRGCQ